MTVKDRKWEIIILLDVIFLVPLKRSPPMNKLGNPISGNKLMHSII